MGLWCCGPACISSRASPPPAEISRIPTSPATPGSIRPSNQPPRYSLSSTMPPPPKALLIPTDQRACVNGDCLMRRDDERVDLHLGQAPVLQQKLRDPEQRGSARGPVRRRAPTGALEQAPPPQLVDHLLGVRALERRHAERDVLERFHEDAAEPKHHDGAKGGISPAPDNHLHALLGHLLDEEAAGPAGESLSQNPKDSSALPLDRVAVGQRKRNASRLRLVRQVGCPRFERYGKADPGRQLRRAPPARGWAQTPRGRGPPTYLLLARGGEPIGPLGLLRAVGVDQKNGAWGK